MKYEYAIRRVGGLPKLDPAGIGLLPPVPVHDDWELMQVVPVGKLSAISVWRRKRAS